MSRTWVIGDAIDNAASALKNPKIFASVNGPLDCATGEQATDAEIQTEVKNLCWGTVLDGHGQDVIGAGKGDGHHDGKVDVGAVKA